MGTMYKLDRTGHGGESLRNVRSDAVDATILAAMALQHDAATRDMLIGTHSMEDGRSTAPLTIEMLRESERLIRTMAGEAIYTPLLSSLRAITTGDNNIAFGYAAGIALTREQIDDNLYRGMFGSRIDPETAAAAKARARGLLQSLLRPEQWAEFERRGTFNERIGEDEFTITPGGMITRKRGALTERWCVNPDPYADGNDHMPVEDMAIGQLLHLRAGPDKVRAAANIFR